MASKKTSGKKPSKKRSRSGSLTRTEANPSRTVESRPPQNQDTPIEVNPPITVEIRAPQNQIIPVEAIPPMIAEIRPLNQVLPVEGPIERPWRLRRGSTVLLPSDQFLSFRERGKEKVGCIRCNYSYSATTSSGHVKKHLKAEHCWNDEVNINEIPTEIIDKVIRRGISSSKKKKKSGVPIAPTPSSQNLKSASVVVATTNKFDNLLQMSKKLSTDIEAFQKLVETVDCRFSLSLNTWYSREEITYITLFVYFTENNWVLSKFLIGLTQMYNFWTSEEICEWLLQVLVKLRIRNRVVACCYERDILGLYSKIMPENCFKLLGFEIFPCLGTCIDRMVNIFMNSSGLYGKLEDIYRIITTKPELKGDFALYFGLKKFSKKLVDFYVFLKDLYLNYELISRSLKEYGFQSLLLSHSELMEVQGVIKHLESAASIMTEFSTTSKIQNFGMCFFTIISILADAENIEPQTKITDDAAEVMKASLENLENVYSLPPFSFLCTFLDPRIHNRCINEDYDYTDAENYLKRYYPKVNIEGVESEPIREEIVRFSQCDFPDFRAQTNPLEWWMTVRQEFPTLSRAARDLMAVTGFSKPAEDIFNWSENEFSKKMYDVSSVEAEFLPLIQWKLSSLDLGFCKVEQVEKTGQSYKGKEKVTSEGPTYHDQGCSSSSGLQR